jgi:DNA primase large subunit
MMTTTESAKIKRIGRNDFRSWFYGAEYRREFEQIIEALGGLDTVISDQVKEYENDYDSLIKLWTKTRKRIYDAHVSGTQTREFGNNENEITYVINTTEPLDDIVSHYAMKIMVASYPNPAFFNWVVENETRVFMKLIDKAIENERANKSTFVCGKEGFITVNELYKQVFNDILGVSRDNIYIVYNRGLKGERTGVNKLRSWVKLYWTDIIDILPKMTDYEIKSGYVKVPYAHFMEILYSLVKQSFTRSFQEYIDSVDREYLTPYKEIVQEIYDDIVEVQGFVSDCQDINEIISNSPLCIYELDRSIQSGMNISHHHAFQLSLYIKKFFDIDGLANYWWKRDRRNSGYATLEDFKHSRRDLMYNFSFQYGIIRGKDYSPMKCKTCQSDGRKCFFQNSTSEIERTLRRLYKDEYASDLNGLNQKIARIISYVEKKMYGLACAAELSLRLKKPIDELKKWNWRGVSINHPLLQYYRTCHGIRNNLKVPSNEPKL